MRRYSRWVPLGLILLAVFFVAVMVRFTDGFGDVVAILFAVGLLVTSYVVRHRARRRLVYRRDRDDVAPRRSALGALRPNLPPLGRNPHARMAPRNPRS